jgi:hypothetical protein
MWRRILRDPWTEKRTNFSVLEEVKPKQSLEATILQLKLRIFGHFMTANGSLERDIMLEKSQDVGGRENHGCDGLTVSRKPLAFGWMF